MASVTHPKESVCSHEELKPLFDELHNHLKNVNSTKQARNSNRSTISTNFLEHIGRTINAKGATGFHTKHEFKPGKGVYIGDVRKSSKPKWLIAAYDIALKIINKVNPLYAGDGEYLVVQFSYMNSSENYFKKHVDENDIDVQYVFTLGDGNCSTIIYDDDNGKQYNCMYKEQILCFDGRMPHMVDTSNLNGDRFAVVYYKVSDPRYKAPAKIQNKPVFVSGPRVAFV